MKLVNSIYTFIIQIW